jgi:hypothetical protein
MTEGTKFLLKQWIPAIAMVGVMAFVIVSGVAGGGVWILVVAVGGMVFYFLVTWQARKKGQRLYQEPSPEALIAYFNATVTKAPNGKALAAFCCAQAATLYGQFDRAREELAAVSWESQEPLYQAFRDHVFSLLALFEKKDYSAAASIGREALEVAAMPSIFPGAAQSRAAFETVVEVSDLLAGQVSEKALAKLELRAKNLPAPLSALPAWALAKYYINNGHPEAAASWQRIVFTVTPHCAPLNDFT